MASSIICILQLCGVVKVRIHLNSIGNNDFVWESGKPQNMMETYFFFVLLSFYLFFFVVVDGSKSFYCMLCYCCFNTYVHTHTHVQYLCTLYCTRTFVTDTSTGTAKTTISQLHTTSPSRTACIRLISKFTVVFCNLDAKWKEDKRGYYKKKGQKWGGDMGVCILS